MFAVYQNEDIISFLFEIFSAFSLIDYDIIDNQLEQSHSDFLKGGWYWMRFLGTGAAEGIPSPFCDCEACRYAREKGGKEIRHRTMFRLDKETCIDMGADFFQQALEYGDFVPIRRVFFTHTHEDHLAYMLMNVRNMARLRRPEPLELYLPGKGFEIAQFYRENPAICKGLVPRLEEQGMIAFRKMEYFKPFYAGQYRLLPLPGNHFGNMGENSANFLIRNQKGQQLYYGLDTGWYLDETFAALEWETASEGLDILVSECTFGLTEGRGEHPAGHLDAYSCIRLFRELLKRRIITPDTRIYLTHINHYTVGHSALQSWFDQQEFPCKITVCWDGFSFDW